MVNTPITIRTVINGREIARDDVLAWEAQRLPKAAAKIGLPAPSGDLARQRLAFADSKLALSPEQIRRRLSRDIRLSSAGSRAMTRLSRGRRAMSICELHVTGGSAAEFVRWFDDTAREDYTRSMIAANPDHFLIQTDPHGRQEVIETTGGNLLTSRFLIDYEDTSTLVTPRNPDFTIEAAGVAFIESGPVIGGVRHEFRDQAGGFYARLCVEFPRVIPSHLTAQHRWHLACEFSNWVVFAFDGLN
ncbi:hypothetical protein [Haloechinothrix salitolerans]|uniref:Uncharacterized protein n=1 Tax=Haloechinothrix salitolerans TaxID=926830 RepID=A0ABW2BY56_9PSEU